VARSDHARTCNIRGGHPWAAYTAGGLRELREWGVKVDSAIDSERLTVAAHEPIGVVCFVVHYPLVLFRIVLTEAHAVTQIAPEWGCTGLAREGAVGMLVAAATR
jgi:hypothetical protein